MTDPIKKLSFAQEMELLREQKTKKELTVEVQALDNKRTNSLPVAEGLSASLEAYERERAMAAAFNAYVGNVRPGSTKGMMFCTNCKRATAGRIIRPGHSAITFGLGALGVLPGIGYMVYREMGKTKRCYHCENTALVPIESPQAVSLCGDAYTDIVKEGSIDMRRAKLDAKRDRMLMFAKIALVGAVAVLAMLYTMRSSTHTGKSSTSMEQQIQQI